jgi:hypothetical protein
MHEICFRGNLTPTRPSRGGGEEENMVRVSICTPLF